jgi:hypothetical protein
MAVVGGEQYPMGMWRGPSRRLGASFFRGVCCQTQPSVRLIILVAAADSAL